MSKSQQLWALYRDRRNARGSIGVMACLAAFNIGWQEYPKREIYSFIPPRGYLT